MRRVVNCVRASCLFGSSGVGELMFIHILQILSALLFSVGFFLTRPELHNLSPPSDALAHVGLKRFNKTIILVVDALRYDFLCPTPSMFCRSPSPSLHSNMHLGDEFQRAPDVPLVLQPYHNNVPFVAEALRDFPENNLLLKFIADPPTTTMQRIKGIVTGSLPTFIDMSRNFGSDRVEEDNLVSQLKSQRSDCCVFMGDDTWMGLLGDHFHVKYPYPSFNVMDLDTVDKGVVSHLIPEIQNRSSRKGWSLIVAHLLGLDHAGHRYNLNNTAIVNKLTEYNQIIKSVSEVMDSDTLLVVMGDHGMTSSGDHGGDTQAETEAALFMHSKPTSVLGSGHRRGNVRSRGRGEKAKSSTQRDDILINWELVQTKLLGANGEASPLSVSQIDLVSTLSVLMGVPIPFSNLGSVIPYLFLDNATLQQALDANIAQITRFMESEGSQFSSFSADPSALSRIEEKLLFLKEVSASYRKLWATFDMPLIILGIAAMANACLLHVCFIHYRMKTKTTIATKSEHNLNGVCSHDYQIRSADSEKTEIFSAGKEKFTRQMSFFSLTSCTITLLASILTAFHYPPYVIALVSPLVFSLLSLTKPKLFYIFHNSAEMFYILLPTLLYGLISGSNSFILNETQCLLFLSNALVIFLVVYGGRSTTFKLSTSLYSVALIAGCNFISRSFIQHPESEELNPILEPLSSLTQDVAHQRLLLTAICLVAFVLLTLKNLFRTENLNSQYFNLVSTWFTAALPVCALCIILFWLQSLQPHSVYEAQSDRIKVLFPRTVYLIVVLGFALFLCEPILVHVQRVRCSKVPQISLEQFDPETDPAKLIPQIAKTLFPSSPSASKNGSAKHNWKLKKGNARQHNGVVQQNGSLKTGHVENSEESSRSSSVSNLSKRSRNSTLTQSSAVANNAHQHSLPKQPVMGARKLFHVVGLSSTALASWHLVSTPAIILLYLLVGNGSSLAFSIMILHAQALCQIATTALHQKEEETQSSNTVSSQVENNGSSQVSSNHQSEPRVTTKLKVETEERLNVDGEREAFDPCAVVSFVGGVAISLLGSYYFYVTGHQLSIASIRFETGYIGFLKDFQSFIVPGFLVVCNTFCAQIAALFFIPMIIYSRFSGSNCHPNTPATAAASVAGGAAAGAFSPVGSSVRSKLDLDSSDGDFWTVLLHNGDRVNRLLLVMFAAFSLTHAIKLCVTMACTSVLRLHLMAYRVFVPNLLFQAVAFLVVLIVQLLLALAHKWIMFRTNTFLTQLNSRR